MKLLLGSLVVSVALTASACAGSGKRESASEKTRANRVVESRLVQNGTVRCTATVLTKPVEAGHPLGTRVRFTFRNITKRKRMVGFDGTAVVRSPDGTTYDPNWYIEHSPAPGFDGPTGASTPPGSAQPASVDLPSLVFDGPLRIIPSCEGAALPAVRVPVTSPGLPKSGRAAVAEVVAATGHLLDRCRPTAPGVPVVGWITTTYSRHRTSRFRARCTISLSRKRGFYVGQVFVVAPPDLRGVRIEPTYEQLRMGNWKGDTEAIAWEFVVTRASAQAINSMVGETDACGGGGGEGGGETLPRIWPLVSHCHY